VAVTATMAVAVAVAIAVATALPHLPKPLLAPLGDIERVARRDAQLALTLQLLDKGRDIAPGEGDVLDGGAWVIEWQWLGGSGTVG
jgi:hypothetical protein